MQREKTNDVVTQPGPPKTLNKLQSLSLTLSDRWVDLKRLSAEVEHEAATVGQSNVKIEDVRDQHHGVEK